MSLTELIVDDVRCIERAELRLHPGHNLIWGGNGSGKTSLLESIFLLGRGRSFRTRNSERLIRHGRERLVVFGRTAVGVLGPATSPSSGVTGRTDSVGLGVADAAGAGVFAGNSEVGALSTAAPGGFGSAADGAQDERVPGDALAATGESGAREASAMAEPLTNETLRGAHAASFGQLVRHQQAATLGASLGQPLGVQVSRSEGTSARIGGANARSLTELTQVFPVQVIDPGIHKLVEEGGHRRRRWMDWAVFHVEPQFGDWWLRYTRTLKQRNAALRRQPAQAAAWDPELIRLGELIAEARRKFVESLLPYWQDSVLALSGLAPELHYFKGWAQDTTLADALASSKPRDEAKGLTHPGPHRADILIRLNGRPAREVLSRGQQKLVAVAMTLAQLNLLQDSTQTTSTLLLDDPAAELDGAHLRRFIEQVMRLRSQLVLTSLHPDSRLFGAPDQAFHVEQGRVGPG